MHRQQVSHGIHVRALRINLDLIRIVSLNANINDFISFNNSDPMCLDLPLRSTDNIRKALLPRSRSTRTKAVFVVGPPGYYAILLNRQHLTTI
jgi:hypothetical protein